VKLVAPRDRAELLAEIADADAVLGKLDPDLYRAAKKLRWFHSISAGVNQYLGADETSPGIPGFAEGPVVLTNGRRCYGPNIADQVFSYLLAFARKTKVSIEGRQRAPENGPGPAGRWKAIDPGENDPELELRGKTLLVLGVGGIGSEVARRAEAFGMKVLAIDPKVTVPPRGVAELHRPADLMDLLPRADVLVLACPYTKQTSRLIGQYQLDAMKKGAYLINVARGPIVDRGALLAALRSGKLAGAGLDVTDPEPLPDADPLWSLPNVIITPHNAGQSDGSARRIFLLARENFRRFAAGERLLNVVDKAAGY
jgi:phosphoglycerate dehydrogenase-like enzyme